jgi:hypothetical protein
MRIAVISAGLVLAALAGCSKKMEMPTVKTEPPKDVKAVGAGSGGSGGLPQPPKERQ